MHICAIDDRLAHDTKWCPTLGECETCGGLVCEHGCQRNVLHSHPTAAPVISVDIDCEDGCGAKIRMEF